MAFKLSKLIKGDGPGRVQSIESIGGDGTPRLPDVAIIDSFPALNYPYHEQELQECRLELLTTIHQLQVTREPTQDILETIRIKKAHHNHIVDSINELQARYRLDPIEKLPPELFISIIQEATFDAIPCDPLYLYSYIVGGLVIVRLTLVSRRWKELITNTPIFWTSIVLDGKSPQNFPNPLKFFELSRQLPVSVSIVYSVTMENSASWQELLKNRDRIVRLFYEDEFRGATRVEHDFKATFRNFMRNLSPLPALESLQYSSSTPHCDGPTIQYALDLCPTLRDIWAPLLPEKQIQYLMSRNCRIINVGQSPEPLWPFLEANSSLRNVRCYQGFSEEGTLPIVTKPLNWEMLSVDHLNVPLSIGITEKITQLVELNIGGYFSALFQLLTNIHRLSRLQALGLTLSINGDMAIIEHLPTSFPSNSTTAFRIIGIVTSEWHGSMKEANTETQHASVTCWQPIPAEILSRHAQFFIGVTSNL
ncbi:hypothetical protein CPB86DRAFT_810469 [Serendipita vermifera]|nr:hypothetical protein CPB86DRAFT_810469 [Serendipita vermifera]